MGRLARTLHWLFGVPNTLVERVGASLMRPDLSLPIFAAFACSGALLGCYWVRRHLVSNGPSPFFEWLAALAGGFVALFVGFFCLLFLFGDTPFDLRKNLIQFALFAGVTASIVQATALIRRRKDRSTATHPIRALLIVHCSIAILLIIFFVIFQATYKGQWSRIRKLREENLQYWHQNDDGSDLRTLPEGSDKEQ
jgi:hypothetical protein